MEELLRNFSSILSNNVYLALVISFMAGIVSSFSPCVLSSIPLVVGYVGESGAKDKNTAFKYSLFFSLGVAMTFTIVGVVVASIGRFINLTGTWWYLILGGIMIFVGLKLIGVIGEGASSCCKVPNKKRGLFGAFFLGILGGGLASPCATPVMAAILAYVAQKGSIILGALMLLLYSIGHSILILIVGTSVGFAQQLSMSSKTKTIGNVMKITLGIIALLIGLYLFYLGF